MSSWNPLSPDSWARSLGMVPVPLFGATRARRHAGQHFILLDGESATCEFSVGESDRLLAADAALSWAWSSNVTHSVIVDPAKRAIFSRRWDSPDSTRAHPLPSEADASRLIASFSADSSPTSQTVIERAIRAFQTVRTAVRQAGGSDENTMRVFITIIEWLRQLSLNELDSAHSSAAVLPASREDLPAISTIPRSLTEMFTPAQVSDVGRFLLEGDQDSSFLLDADLLIRHASGSLSQEAHLQIARSPQLSLFLTGGIETSITVGEPKNDAYFTPPSLARLLVEESLAEFRSLNPGVRTVDVLDPACGSGVFLIEAARELQGSADIHLHLRGMDTSPIARLMTEYNLTCIANDTRSDIEISVQLEDALTRIDWANPDIIVMNPPFSSWEMMDKNEHAVVRQVLADLYFGRADKASAFIVKAVQNLREGAVLATLAPQSMLTSRFASKIRDTIASDPSLHVKMIGLFSGYGYFHGAIVEPAFLLISRSARKQKEATTFVLAPDRSADFAIRALRLRRNGITAPSWPDVHIHGAYLTAQRWKPEPPGVQELRRRVESYGIPQIKDLFEVREGIRTGRNDVFILRKWQLEECGVIPETSDAFRPDASNTTIHVARIVPSRYVFYPYHDDGSPMFSSEQQLSAALPLYYSEILKPKQNALLGRKGVRGNWWELTRPRTWQARRTPRIISTVFADAGGVTFDESGNCAVTQAFYWQWMGAPLSQRVVRAYIAILNSTVFIEMCRMNSRSMRGGQVDFYPHHVNDVLIPDLSATGIPSRVLDELEECGAEMLAGSFFRLERVNMLCARLYGIAEDDVWDATGTRSTERARERFKVLARRWKRDTGARGTVERMTRHPAYQEILQMGRDVVPFIIEDLSGNNPAPWFGALAEITGTEAVKAEHRGFVDQMAEDWRAWAKKEGIIQ